MFAKSNNAPPTDWFNTPAHHDTVSMQFISIICFNADLDIYLCNFAPLFVDPPPRLDGGYSHHDGYRTVN